MLWQGSEYVWSKFHRALNMPPAYVGKYFLISNECTSYTLQYIGFFVIAGLLELFTAYARPANVRPVMRDY